MCCFLRLLRRWWWESSSFNRRQLHLQGSSSSTTITRKRTTSFFQIIYLPIPTTVFLLSDVFQVYSKGDWFTILWKHNHGFCGRYVLNPHEIKAKIGDLWSFAEFNVPIVRLFQSYFQSSVFFFYKIEAFSSILIKNPWKLSDLLK